jgi:hypothetical protein
MRAACIGFSATPTGEGHTIKQGGLTATKLVLFQTENGNQSVSLMGLCDRVS